MFCFTVSYGQIKLNPIDPAEYENRAQAYAILSAQFSNYSYEYVRRSYFSNNNTGDIDTAYVLAEVALDYADSALQACHDSIVVAEAHMKKTEQLLYGSRERLMKSKKSPKSKYCSIWMQKTILDLGYATNYAYYASLFIAGELNNRDVKRLEVDEYSYSTIKDLYKIRLVDVKQEIARIESGKQGTVDKELLANLKKEEKQLEERIKMSGEQLLAIRQAWSKEVFKEVDNQVFTTMKNDFYSEDNPIPADVTLPKGLVYRVQLGFFSNKKPEEAFGGVFPLSLEQEKKVDKIYLRYIAGLFDNYSSARKAKETLKGQAQFNDVFVIAYLDGKRIPVSEAVKIEQKK